MFSRNGIAGLAALLRPEAGFAVSKQVSVARRAMACEFTLVFPAGFRAAVDAGCSALDEIERLEKKLSVYRPDSDLSYINRAAAAEPVRADAEVFNLLLGAARLSEATGGAFDAAAGALVKAWGFFKGPKRVPADAERIAALSATGTRHVEFDAEAGAIRFHRPGVEFNLGGIGKGYAIDRALGRIRREFGARSVLMQGGQSSLKAAGAPPGEPRGWKVAIDNPCRPGRPIAHVWLRDRALGTSGTANQFFVSEGRRYGHILDPRTGWPAERLAGASVIAGSAAEADALSTAFFVLGEEGAHTYCREHPEIGAVLVLKPRRQAAPEAIVLGAADAEVIL